MRSANQMTIHFLRCFGGVLAPRLLEEDHGAPWLELAAFPETIFVSASAAAWRTLAYSSARALVNAGAAASARGPTSPSTIAARARTRLFSSFNRPTRAGRAS